MSAKLFKICYPQKFMLVKFFKIGHQRDLKCLQNFKDISKCVINYSAYVKILESQVQQRRTRQSNHNKVFDILTFIYVYLVVITIMAVWQFVHLGTHMYGYMLLAFKKFCVDISRKIQKQYDTNKNHVNFIMVPFLVYINQFLLFLISVS